jgi:hypothetical protein
VPAAPRSRPRLTRAGLVAVAALAGPLALAAPAWADGPATSGSSEGGITLLQGLGLFAAIPLSVVALVFALVYGLSGRGSRSRTAAALAATPVWFNGPEDSAASPASPAALPAGDGAAPPHGGASARW